MLTSVLSSNRQTVRAAAHQLLGGQYEPALTLLSRHALVRGEHLTAHPHPAVPFSVIVKFRGMFVSSSSLHTENNSVTALSRHDSSPVFVTTDH